MIDVQKGLGLKNIFDLFRKEIQGIFETKNPTEEQIKKHKRSENELDRKNIHSSSLIKYVRCDVVKKIIKNCKGVKECNDCISKMKKEKQRENFRILLGFKENDLYERKEYSIIKT